MADIASAFELYGPSKREANRTDSLDEIANAQPLRVISPTLRPTMVSTSQVWVAALVGHTYVFTPSPLMLDGAQRGPFGDSPTMDMATVC